MNGLESLVLNLRTDAVATVGRLDVHPNAVNVIADRVEFTIDFRSGVANVLQNTGDAIPLLLETFADHRGLGIEVEETEAIAVCPLSERLVAALAGGSLPVVTSGALHDSAVLAPHVPTVMLFVPSQGGISHNPAEFSRVEDVAVGCEVIEKLVRRPTVEAVNAMGREAFVAAFGGIFEGSPWIAERGHAGGPFASVADLSEKLCKIVVESSAKEQLGLVAAHPDLVGRLAREGRLTAESTSEQAAAGLSDLSPAEVEAFEGHNAAYREKFGFPFVICARENRKDAILAAFPARLENDRDAELRTALAEIYKIARLRIQDVVWDSA